MVKLLITKQNGLRRHPRSQPRTSQVRHVAKCSRGHQRSIFAKTRTLCTAGDFQKFRVARYSALVLIAGVVLLVLEMNIDDLSQYSDQYYSELIASMQALNNESRSEDSDDNISTHEQPTSSLLVRKGPVVLNECLLKANKEHIQSKLVEQRQNNIPLLASFMPAPNRVELEVRQQQHHIDKINEDPVTTHYWTATFSLCHITWKKASRQRKRIPQVSDSRNWKCDGQPAKVIADGCPSGSTVIVQCPQTQSMIVSNLTWNNYTYFVADHASCEQTNPLRTNSENLPHAKIVASLIIYQMRTTILLEWLEYHRSIIGVDHFFIYVMQSQVGDFPNMEYITYIPFDLNPNMISLNDRFLFQTAAQTDTLHRARRHGGIEWVIYNDLDEYFDILKKRKGTNENSDERLTLPEYLDSRDKEGRRINQFDAIQVESASFGNNQPGGERDLPFLLNYTTRMVNTWKKRRCKSIAKATRIDYVNIHWVIGPEQNRHYPDPVDELLIHHYKNPYKGPFNHRLGSTNRSIDSRLADLYADPIQRRVWNIMNQTGHSHIV